MEYYCSYCKDEKWVPIYGGLLDSPCPMNCAELKAIEDQEFSKKLNRKYYLHGKIKKQGFIYNSYKKTVEIPVNSSPSKEVRELGNVYGYNLQITIV